MPPIITLTTDFGLRDPYVASMKGVIASICPDATVMDLTHEIAPQDVFEAALFLATATPLFPKGVIHVAVIDPGVGAARRPIVARAAGRLFVCPDNGLLTLVSHRMPLDGVRAITNPRFMRQHVSPTFHGRDVFAPAAAHLAVGAPLEDIGEPVVDPVLLDIPEPGQEDDGRICGEVIHADRFGNLTTNIPRAALSTKVRGIMAGRVELEELRSTYGDVPEGEPLALVGSSGFLEIAVNCGNARQQLVLDVGAHVIVNFQ